MNVQPAYDRPADDRTRNVLVVGVGGQGVLMVSKVLARLCQASGYDVKQSEVHGMAKRGGVVFSHVRYGRQVWSPTIPEGSADVLVALEWAEGLRWLSYLNPESGTFIADTQQIVPPFACRNRQRGALSRYATETPAEVLAKVARGYALDADGIATRLGNARASNTVLLGALSTALDFSQEDWLAAIAELVPPKTIDLNVDAFHRGRGWVEDAGDTPPPPPPVRDALAFGDLAPLALLDELKPAITEAWCKGCDICVKMCPERCLTLNAELIVELAKPEACTGCRICEWLCPDFAIEMRRVPAGAPDSVTAGAAAPMGV